MNDEQIVEYLRSRSRVDAPMGLSDRVMAEITSTPVHRSWFAGFLPAVVTVAAVAVVAVVATLVVKLPPSGGPSASPSFPIVASDPRFAACGGGLGNGDQVIAAFPFVAADYQRYFPNMGRSPELEVDQPAFAVVFDEGVQLPDVLGPISQPSPPASPSGHMVCVYVGDEPDGESYYYVNVDVTGMLAELDATASPTANSSPSVYAPDYDSFAEVAVETLPLYADQDLNSQVVGEVLAFGATDTDQHVRVYVTDRPAMDGWRRVETWVSTDGASGWAFAWAPLELDGQSTLRPTQLQCPDTRVQGLSSVMAGLTPPELLVCFGSTNQTLRGSAQEADFGSGFGGDPAWLVDAPDLALLAGSPETWGPILSVHVDPTAGGFPVGEEVEATGHFNDERSSGCRRTDLPAGMSETAEESALWCAQQFVVVSINRVNPIPTPTPVTYRPNPGGPFTVIDSAQADALFETVDTCTNPVGNFTIAFPASWYTNATVGELPACSWFSPVPFEVSNVRDMPDSVAIVITAIDGGFGVINSPDYDLAETVSIGGRDGFRGEQIGIGYEGGGYERIAPSYRYGVSFEPAPSLGPSLDAATSSEGAVDYVLNKAVLDRMMASLIYLGRD